MSEKKTIEQCPYEIVGASYIGNPKSNTVMYVTKKVEGLLNAVGGGVCECLIFAESNIEVSKKIDDNNYVVLVDNPQLHYTRYVNAFAEKKKGYDKKRRYTLTKEGYYLGENVTIGKNAYIEPNCLIGHDVVIGDDVVILSGAVIKNSIIGDSVYINEYAIVGANGFTMVDDEEGNKLRIPTIGKVIVGNYVEIGAHDNISCGSAGDTVLEDYVKLDALVHIGHDVHLYKNAEITAGCVVGGFAQIKENTFCGINSTVRNRVIVGKDCLVGMGTVVNRSAEDNKTVVGNPMRELTR